MEFVDDHLDGLLAPAEVGLADEDLDLALADILEGKGQGVHGDDLGVLVDAVQGVVGVEGPAADEGPAGDVGVGGLDLLHACGGFGGGFGAEVVDILDGDAGELGGGLLHAADAVGEVDGGGVAGQDGDGALATHDAGELTHHFHAGLGVVHTVVGHAAGFGGVGVEGDDDDALVHGGAEGAVEDVGVGHGDGDAVDAGGDELLDELGLDLGVLLRGCVPLDTDIHAEFFAEALARGLGAGPGGLEDGVGVALGDHADGVGCFRGGGSARAGGGGGGFVGLLAAGGGQGGGEQEGGGQAGGVHGGLRMGCQPLRAASRCLVWSMTTAMIMATPITIWL